MFSILASVTLIFAIILAIQGTWIIIPFAAGHLIFVWWGFYHAYKNSEIIQYLIIEPKQTILGNSKIGHIQHFDTPWLKVKLIKDKKNPQSMRLFLFAHDKMREIGLGIIVNERVELFHAIQRTLAPFSAY